MTAQYRPEGDRTSLSSLLRYSFRQQIKALNTCLPGTVVSFDADSGLASVKPALYVVETGERRYEMPTLNNVPVIFPSAAGFRITFALSAGDHVLLLFSQRGLDDWLASDYELSAPTAGKFFDLDDAVALPGFAAGPVADDPRISDGTTHIDLTSNGVEITGDVTITGNLTVTGTLTGGTHTHGP